MDELGKLRKKRIEEIQNKQEEDQQFQNQVEQLEVMVRQVLTKDALLRYGNLKTAHPQKAVQLLVVLGRAIQSGKVDKIDDSQLKDILHRLTEKKRETKIKRI